jgi:hypothetical protein
VPIAIVLTGFIDYWSTTTFTVKVKSDKDFAAPYIAAQYPGSTILAAPDDDTSASSIPRPWVQSGLSIVEVKELNDTLPIETNLPMPNFRS